MYQRPLSAIEEDDSLLDPFRCANRPDLQDVSMTSAPSPRPSEKHGLDLASSGYATLSRVGGGRSRFSSDQSDFHSDVVLKDAAYGDYSEIGQCESPNLSSHYRSANEAPRMSLTKYRHYASKPRHESELKYTHPYSVIETSAIRRQRKRSRQAQSERGSYRAARNTPISRHKTYSVGENRSRKTSFTTYRSIGTYASVSKRTAEIHFDDDLSEIMLIVLRLLAGITFSLYILLIVLFILFATAGHKIGMFESTLGEAFGVQETVMRPSISYYCIYFLMYIWNLFWILWSQSVVCQNQEHGWFRSSPTVLSTSFHCHFILSLLCVLVWFFILDNQYPYGCLWILLILTCSSFSASLSLCFNFRSKREKLLQSFTREFWILKVFAQNGVMCLVFLFFFELCGVINFIVVLNGGSQNTSSNSLLTIICAVLIIYSVLDFLLFEETLRFVITPYFAFIWFGVNLLSRNIDSSSSKNSNLNEDDSALLVFSIAICIISLVLALLRVFHACYQIFSTDDLSNVDVAEVQSSKYESAHEMTPRDIRYSNDDTN